MKKIQRMTVAYCKNRKDEREHVFIPLNIKKEEWLANRLIFNDLGPGLKNNELIFVPENKPFVMCWMTVL